MDSSSSSTLLFIILLGCFCSIAGLSAWAIVHIYMNAVMYTEAVNQHRIMQEQEKNNNLTEGSWPVTIRSN